MFKYKISYAFKRYRKWFVDSTVIETKLQPGSVTQTVLRKEIEASEFVPVRILEIDIIK